MGFIKDGIYLGQLSDCGLIINEYAPWNELVRYAIEKASLNIPRKEEAKLSPLSTQNSEKCEYIGTSNYRAEFEITLTVLKWYKTVSLKQDCQRDRTNVNKNFTKLPS
jgi:hypothetical protein